MPGLVLRQAASRVQRPGREAHRLGRMTTIKLNIIIDNYLHRLGIMTPIKRDKYRQILLVISDEF